MPAPALTVVARRTVARPLAAVLIGICSLGLGTFAQSQPQTGAPAPSFGDNVGRGFADSEDSFAEPAFDLPPDKPAARPHQQVLPRPQQTEGDSAEILPGVSSMQVTDIVLTGNTVLSPAAIAQITEPFAHRTLSPENLQELRRRLSLLYYNEGYVNSGVLLPEHIPERGTLNLRAVEGGLSKIEWLSPGRLAPAFLEARLRRGIGEPLNVYELQDSLRGLELNPMIRKINASLIPGLAPGEADLQLRIEEAKPVRLGLALDNHRSPSVGAERGTVSLEHLNLTGRGDRLAFRASASEGLKDAYIDYTRPLNSRDTRLWLGYQRGESEVIEAPFDQLDIESDTESWGISLSHPVVDRLDRSVELLLGLNHSRSETWLLGRPFSFSLGARDGKIAATNVSVGAEWIERGDDDVLALRASLRYGLDWFGATTIPDASPTRQAETGARIPESQFTVLLTQVQYARRLAWLDSQLVFSSVWQQAFDSLLSVEKMALGGVYSVRGFRENQLVRDSGVSGSLEWRVPLFSNNGHSGRWNITAVPFVDYGRSWDHDSSLSTHRAAELGSIGLGFRWRPAQYLHFSLFYAESIVDDDVPQPAESDLQDDGFHVAVAFNWPL
ncbi:MAG: ShlB/FhaC/HecB family hemolysin secretion/activation protein [Haliea sp.]|uniref:ShlB/FhaC/HecB family hemolysin secretion/activation protein n=1 Tax=Haliea sp. TaxID=1932666 RepID=UPI0032F09C31